jgi:hypothetical protein
MKFKTKIFTSIFFILLVSSVSLVAGENITREMAISAINESEQIMIQMKESNFSVNYINDTLIQAKKVFEQVDYAEILRGNSTVQKKQEAAISLRLIKWQNITYADVLVYTNDIKNRKETAYLLLDKITVEEKNLAGLSLQTRQFFYDAKTAFYEERYSDAEKLLSDFKSAVEKEKASSLTFSGLKTGAMNFFQRYWVYIVITLILIGIASYFVYKKIKKKSLVNRIRKRKTEEKVLLNLIKKTQEERFKENNISSLVYNIRIKKYEEKLQEIKEELPVLEENLKRFKNKHDVINKEKERNGK